jgi:hypothetical protein
MLTVTLSPTRPSLTSILRDDRGGGQGVADIGSSGSAKETALRLAAIEMRLSVGRDRNPSTWSLDCFIINSIR